MNTPPNTIDPNAVGQPEAGADPITTSPPPPASGSVRVGDKYHLHGKTITITFVSPGNVMWNMLHDGRLTYHSSGRKDFERMERKSFERGAVFEPAPALNP